MLRDQAFPSLSLPSSHSPYPLSLWPRFSALLNDCSFLSFWPQTSQTAPRMMDLCNTVAHLKLTPLLHSLPDAMICPALQQAILSVLRCKTIKRLTAVAFISNSAGISGLVPFSFKKRQVIPYFKQSLILLLTQAVVWKQRSWDPTCFQGIKTPSCTLVLASNVYTILCPCRPLRTMWII